MMTRSNVSFYQKEKALFKKLNTPAKSAGFFDD